MKKAEFTFNVQLVLIDFLMLVAAGSLAYLLRATPWLESWRSTGEFFDNFTFGQYFPAMVAAAAGWLLIFAIAGLYKSKINSGTFEDFSKIVVSCSAGVTAITIFIFFGKLTFDSRFIILASWLFAIILVTLGRLVLRQIWRTHNFGFRKVVLIGDKNISRQVKIGLESNPYLCSKIVMELPDSGIDSIQDDLQGVIFDELILCSPDCPREKISVLANYCEEGRIDFRFIPDLQQTFFTNISVESIAGFPILELKRTPLEGWGRFAKRTTDIILSFSGIVLLSPLWLVIAIAIKLDSKGPAVVKLKRVSKGKEFYLYKFRSMKNNSHGLKKRMSEFNERNDGPFFKIKKDPRVTAVGKFIRNTWIDEFPQLINVLKGEMSLVGPRPHEPEEIASYQNRHKRVFFVKSGMTGLAQINGSSNLKFEEEIKLDLYYVKNWSLFWDAKILLKTFILFFKPKQDC